MSKFVIGAGMLFDPKQITEEDTKITVEKDPKASGLEEMEDSLFRKYKQKVGKVVEKLDQIGLPAPGEQFRLITRRSFNAIEMLQYIAEREKIVDLRMAVYSINFFAAKILLEMINEGRIENCEVLMSNLRNAAHREKEVILKNLFTIHPRIRLWFCSSHAKIISCRTENGNYYTIEGSGNHAYNSRIEQYVIDNDADVYDFTCCWMSEIKEFLAGKKELQEG